MKIWAIADLHLSFAVPHKKMDIFGAEWESHYEKIERAWDSQVSSEDLVLIPGDVSWAMRLEEAKEDLAWIHARPGSKVLIKGNHDYWWDSLAKLRHQAPPSLHFIQNDAFLFHDVAITGSRLWESDEYSFGGSPAASKEDTEALFTKECMRLETSLRAMPQTAKLKIGMTHFPPIGFDLAPSRASSLFERYGVSHVVFGHLHALPKEKAPIFGKGREITYSLVSADWLDFAPLLVKEL